MFTVISGASHPRRSEHGGGGGGGGGDCAMGFIPLLSVLAAPVDIEAHYLGIRMSVRFLARATRFGPAPVEQESPLSAEGRD